MRVLYALGRAVVGGFFLYNGINHFKQTDALAGYAAAKHVTHPETAVQMSGALMTLSGFSLVFGLRPRLGALGALGFLGAASAMFYDFWNVEDPQQRQTDMIQFSKNVALMGAALALIGAESDRQSSKM